MYGNTHTGAELHAQISRVLPSIHTAYGIAAHYSQPIYLEDTEPKRLAANRLMWVYRTLLTMLHLHGLCDAGFWRNCEADFRYILRNGLLAPDELDSTPIDPHEELSCGHWSLALLTAAKAVESGSLAMLLSPGSHPMFRRSESRLGAPREIAIVPSTSHQNGASRHSIFFRGPTHYVGRH